MRPSAGAKPAKPFAARAASQAVCPSTSARASSAASRAGIRVARAWSRAASARLTARASSPTPGPAAAIHSGTRGSLVWAWIAAATAAACSPRRAAPLGGICVSRSQVSSPATCSSAAIRRRCSVSSS